MKEVQYILTILLFFKRVYSTIDHDFDETIRQENIYSKAKNSENNNNKNINFNSQFYIPTSSIKLEKQKQFQKLPAYHLQVPNPLQINSSKKSPNTLNNHSSRHKNFFKLTLQNLDHKTIKSSFSEDLIIHVGEDKTHSRIFDFHQHEFHPDNHLWMDDENDSFCAITKEEHSILYCDLFGVYHIQKHNKTHHYFYSKSVFNSKHSKPLLNLENVETHKLSKRDLSEDKKYEPEIPTNEQNYQSPEILASKSNEDQNILSSKNSNESPQTTPRSPPCIDCVCSLAIYVDTEFFKNYGESDVQKTYGLVVSAIHALNQYYSKQVRQSDLKDFNQGKLNQADANKNFWKATLGINSLQFQMKYLKIHEEYTKLKDGDSSGVFYNFKEKPIFSEINKPGGYSGFPSSGITSHWTPYAKLTYFAKSHSKGDHNHGKYCLAHLFTYHDFENGTIGLAFLANVARMLLNNEESDEYSQSGICAKPKRDESDPNYPHDYYQNTALTTFKNYGVNVATAEAHLVTAHEIGHNLGAAHDCSFKRTGNSQGKCEVAKAECMGDSKSGDWLMAEHAVSGDKPNNHRFSNCSADYIRKVTYGKIFNCLKGKDVEPL